MLLVSDCLLHRRDLHGIIWGHQGPQYSQSLKQHFAVLSAAFIVRPIISKSQQSCQNSHYPLRRCERANDLCILYHISFEERLLEYRKLLA